MYLKKLLLQNSFFGILKLGGSMKIDLKKVISFIFAVLIIIFFVVFLIWFLNKRVDKKTNTNQNNEKTEEIEKGQGEIPKEPETYLNNITYDVKLDKEIGNKIIEYMDLYYKSMKQLKEYDMTYLFSNQEQGNINQTAVSLLIDIRKLKPNDLTLSSALYDLRIESVTKSGDTINVVVRENNYLRFNFMKDIESKTYNIENNFTFKLIDGEYKISKYSKVQDFYVMITSYYQGGGKAELDKLKNSYITLIKQKESDLKQDYQDYLNNTGINVKTCDHDYDRTKAYNYAIKWVNKRSSEWPEYNSNCQNYASQVVYAGGVPMDYNGSYKWGNYNKLSQSGTLDTTWTYVPYFYSYVKNNTGYGICGDVDVNLYYAEAGDVIHVGISGPTKHALVVIGTYKKDEKVVDVLVNSNTVDLENYPISAYVYPYTELIKIYGWNE